MNLEQIPTLNDAAVAAFDVFSKRRRFRSNTNLSRFHRELELKYGTIDENQLLETFKALENAGMGSLIMSRKKDRTRFAWNYSLKDVARMSKGEISKNEAYKISKPQRRLVVPKVQPRMVKPEPKVETVDVLVIDNGRAEKYSIPVDRIDIFKTFVNSLK